MLITGRADVAHGVSAARAFGIDDNIVADRSTAGLYDVSALGSNYRMNEIGAALGIEQLKRLPDFLQHRRRNFERLREGLSSIEAIEFLDSSAQLSQQSHYCLAIVLKDPWWRRRSDILQGLKKRGVGTSIYYPRPVPLLSYYREKYDPAEDSFPVASRISHRSLALPVAPHVTMDDIDYIVNNVEQAIKRVE